jgi:hypothetical protein
MSIGKEKKEVKQGLVVGKSAVAATKWRRREGVGLRVCARARNE